MYQLFRYRTESAFLMALLKAFLIESHISSHEKDRAIQVLRIPLQSVALELWRNLEARARGLKRARPLP